MVDTFRPGEKILGRYILIEHIGRGGMAEVYKASDLFEGGFVALKVLSRFFAQDPKVEKRFKREIRVLMGMDHPNIVHLKEVGEHEGFTVLVMPYLDVGSLSDRLAKGVIGMEEGARIVDHVASALQYSHDQGVIHRDVKPSNILLNKDGDAFLTDFGIARVHETLVSLTGSALLGTPAYMSPEQARGDTVTEKSDQYSLGVVLFQMATGQLPYGGETPMAVMYKHIYEPLPSPRSVRPSIPPIMDRFIRKATAKRPQDRFESIAEMRSVFRQAIGHILRPDKVPEPKIDLNQERRTTLLTTKDPQWDLLALWKRYPIRIGISLVVVLASLIGLTVFAFSAANREPPVTGTDRGESLAQVAYEETISAMALALEQEGTPLPTDAVQTLVAGTIEAEGGQNPSALVGSTVVTGSPTITIAETDTPVPSSVAAATDTRTPTRTHAPVIPSATRTRTPTPTLTSTPTHTPTSTSTFTPTSTFTITPSPTPDVCATTSLGSLAVDGFILRAVLRSDGSATVSVTGISVHWPRENEALKSVEIGGQRIWDGTRTSSPLDLTLSDPYNLSAGDSVQLLFTFSEPAQGSGYSLSIRLNAVCSISGGL